MNLAKSLAAIVIISLFGPLAVSQAADQRTSKKATVGPYRLVKGKGYTVCEAFLKNLNAFPATEPPMVCEQKIHPSHPEFTKPVWEEMDVQNNLNIIYAAESLLPEFTPLGSQPLSFYDWLPAFRERVKNGKSKPRLRKIEAALNANGPETLISYEPVIDQCSSDLKTTRAANGPGGHLFVLITGVAANRELHNYEGGGRIEAEVSGINAILQTINAITWSPYDVLMYRGKPIFMGTHTDPKENMPVSGPHPWIWWFDLAPIADSGSGTYTLTERCMYELYRSDKPVGIQ